MATATRLLALSPRDEETASADGLESVRPRGRSRFGERRNTPTRSRSLPATAGDAASGKQDTDNSIASYKPVQCNRCVAGICNRPLRFFLPLPMELRRVALVCASVATSQSPKGQKLESSRDGCCRTENEVGIETVRMTVVL